MNHLTLSVQKTRHILDLYATHLLGVSVMQWLPSRWASSQRKQKSWRSEGPVLDGEGCGVCMCVCLGDMRDK